MTTRPHSHAIPEDILALSHERDALRKRGQYDRADVLKRQIEEAGFAIKDNPRGGHLIILPSVEVDGKIYRTARDMPSLLDEVDTCMFSVQVQARHDVEGARRCVESVLRFADEHDVEVTLVNNAGGDEMRAWADELGGGEPRLRVLHTSRAMGAAEARNVGLRQNRGKYVVLIDTSAEVTGDVFTPLAEALAEKNVGIAGLHGLRTWDLRHFEESGEGERQVEAVDGLCMAFRRKLLREVGLFDEKYRFAAFMDIDFNFMARESGAEVVVMADLPVRVHLEQQDDGLAATERARLTKRNFYRFLEKWGEREDLLLEEEE